MIKAIMMIKPKQTI